LSYLTRISTKNFSTIVPISHAERGKLNRKNIIIKPVKNKKLTKELNKRIKKGKWITKSQKLLLISYIKNAQNTIAETTLTYPSPTKVNYLIESYLRSLLFHIYAIELLSLSIYPELGKWKETKDKINILNILRTFMHKDKWLPPVYLAIEQLFLLVLEYNRLSINREKIIEDLYLKLKNKKSIWYGNISCFNLTKYNLFTKIIPTKYKILIKNIINKTYYKYNHLLFIDYILKDFENFCSEDCNIIRFGTKLVIINDSSVMSSKVNEYLNVRGLKINNCIKVKKSFTFLDYTFIIANKVYINPSFMNIKKRIKYILKSSYNLSNIKLVRILNPIVRKWTSNCNNGKTLIALKKYLLKRLKIYLIKKHKKVSIGRYMNRYTPLFCKWNKNLRNIYR